MIGDLFVGLIFALSLWFAYACGVSDKCSRCNMKKENSKDD